MISPTTVAARSLPDITHETRPLRGGVLDWVGMDRMEMPVTVVTRDGRAVTTPAWAGAFVDLADTQARGIHMSRLYLALDEALTANVLTPALVARTLGEFVRRHEDISGRALLELEFDLLVRRAALRSEESGWRRYPVKVTGLYEHGAITLEMGAQILYSSTCPCSAALGRQLIQEKFERDFDPEQPLDYEEVLAWLGTDQGIVATPHSQRSRAEVRVRLAEEVDDFQFLDLVDLVEDALQTPVQAAVKREDEQAFTLLNGQNLMFCEDAGRRMRHALERDARFVDFWARATHEESLHPHDAVSVVTRGVAGGFAPSLTPPASTHTRVRTSDRDILR